MSAITPDNGSRGGSLASLMQSLRSGAAAPLVVLAMLSMVVVPLPPFLLDLLFTINIALSLMVLLAVVYVRRPLEFSVFPSVLLMVTLLRLSLNVASTRVVLLHGHQGERGGQQQEALLPVEPLGVAPHARLSAASSTDGAGAWVRRTSQMTPSTSQIPTRARPRLVYFDVPCSRAWCRTGWLISGWP